MTVKPRVALFIDAENTSARNLPQFLDHCHLHGRLSIARCYGGAASLKQWEKAIAQYHLVPVLTPPSAGKDNASDFALTIDAVSLLHRGLFDHAVIATSDADFIQLAIHIREHGKGVEGIGEHKATQKLQSAFDSYTMVGKSPTPKPQAARETAKPSVSASSNPAIDTDLLVSVFKEHEGTDKKLSVQEFGKALAKRLPANYRKGHGTLTSYLKKSRAFDIKDNVVSLHKS